MEASDVSDSRLTSYKSFALPTVQCQLFTVRRIYYMLKSYVMRIVNK